MAKPTITTPKGCIIQTANGKAELQWNDTAIATRKKNFEKAQRFVDNAVLSYCKPLVPFQTGMLVASGTLGTEIGSGEVRYIAPYAAMQYYNTAESRPYDGQRGAKWFERMKTAHGKDILEGAKKITGGK